MNFLPLKRGGFLERFGGGGLIEDLRCLLHIYLRTLSFFCSFFMSFLSCSFTHLRPRDVLRVFPLVVVVFNYIKYVFIFNANRVKFEKRNPFP